MQSSEHNALFTHRQFRLTFRPFRVVFSELLTRPEYFQEVVDIPLHVGLFYPTFARFT